MTERRVPAYDGMVEAGSVFLNRFEVRVAPNALVDADSLDGEPVYLSDGAKLGILISAPETRLLPIPSPGYPDMKECGVCGWSSDNWGDDAHRNYLHCPNCGCAVVGEAPVSESGKMHDDMVSRFR